MSSRKSNNCDCYKRKRQSQVDRLEAQVKRMRHENELQKEAHEANTAKKLELAEKQKHMDEVNRLQELNKKLVSQVGELQQTIIDLQQKVEKLEEMDVPHKQRRCTIS